ncbi:hypothetical protein BT69DRAFT_1344973 [Atractiella rhizophila]|nr:hypothetical protein BT69DRAFT_1344973 [Atractiella rhizophila]
MFKQAAPPTHIASWYSSLCIAGKRKKEREWMDDLVPTIFPTIPIAMNKANLSTYLPAVFCKFCVYRADRGRRRLRSKAAVHSFTMSLRADLKATGHRVQVVESMQRSST